MLMPVIESSSQTCLVAVNSHLYVLSSCRLNRFVKISKSLIVLLTTSIPCIRLLEHTRYTNSVAFPFVFNVHGYIYV